MDKWTWQFEKKVLSHKITECKNLTYPILNLTLKGYFLTLRMQIAESVERNAYVRPPRHLHWVANFSKEKARLENPGQLMVGTHSAMWNPGQPIRQQSRPPNKIIGIQAAIPEK